jgi:hypothetical protein
LLAWVIADAGTLYRRPMLSTVSPCATVIGVPLSKVQLLLAAGWGVAIAPVTSAGAFGCDPVVLGAYGAIPLPPPATPEFVPVVDGDEETCGSGRLSTRFAPAVEPGAIEPVASGPLENGLSLKRDVSPLHAERLIVTRASAAAHGNGERNQRTVPAIATHTPDTRYEALS